MKNYYKYFKPALFSLPAETSHNMAVWAMSNNILPKQEFYRNSILKQTLFGIEFANPVGMAAGFDKNARCLEALSNQNFGFAEIGTTTPVPQSGNPKPRLFRIKEDEAVVNRMGFNNEGVEIYSQRLRKWKYAGVGKCEMVVGANIGKNKDSANDSSDYLTCFDKVYDLCDYVTINISSPNTPNLRELQKKESLDALLKDINNRKKEFISKNKKNTPILVKISPDENDENLSDIAEVIINNNIAGVIISNTSIKSSLINNSGFAENKISGGISGKPLLKLSTQTQEKFYKITEGKVPIIGVGGIFSAQDAYEKICKGASLVQIYSAFIYKGFGLVNEINKGLAELLEADGFENITQAIGSKVVR
jgi:dihydroorotate dehydrogenase